MLSRFFGFGDVLVGSVFRCWGCFWVMEMFLDDGDVFGCCW